MFPMKKIHHEKVILSDAYYWVRCSVLQGKIDLAFYERPVMVPRFPQRFCNQMFLVICNFCHDLNHRNDFRITGPL